MHHVIKCHKPRHETMSDTLHGLLATTRYLPRLRLERSEILVSPWRQSSRPDSDQFLRVSR